MSRQLTLHLGHSLYPRPRHHPRSPRNTVTVTLQCAQRHGPPHAIRVRSLRAHGPLGLDMHVAPRTGANFRSRPTDVPTGHQSVGRSRCRNFILISLVNSSANISASNCCLLDASRSMAPTARSPVPPSSLL